MYLLGSHVGMSGKDMMLGSVKTALSYGANTFMLYTGAPQNTRRKPVDELCIPQAQERMRQNNITRFVVHAPYIINLANTVKPEVFSLAVEFLAKEIERTEAMGSDVLILHPGSHVGAGTDAGIHQIIEGLNEVLTVHHGFSAHAHMGADQERLAICVARRLKKWIHRFSISAKIYMMSGLKGLSPTYEQAHVGLDLLTLAS